ASSIAPRRTSASSPAAFAPAWGRSSLQTGGLQDLQAQVARRRPLARRLEARPERRPARASAVRLAEPPRAEGVDPDPAGDLVHLPAQALAAMALDEGVEPEEPEVADDETVTELFVQLGRDLSVLGLCEAQLTASRHMPEVRRAVRDLTAAFLA